MTHFCLHDKGRNYFTLIFFSLNLEHFGVTYCRGPCKMGRILKLPLREMNKTYNVINIYNWQHKEDW